MNKPLFTSPFFSLSYDETYDWLLAEWHGTHNTASSSASCACIMKHVQSTACSRLLCDSSLAYDGWSEIRQWVSTNYLPQLADAGVVVIAWVNAKGYNINLDLERMLHESIRPVVGLFDEGVHAYDWLVRYPSAARKGLR